MCWQDDAFSRSGQIKAGGPAGRVISSDDLPDMNPTNVILTLLSRLGPVVTETAKGLP